MGGRRQKHPTEIRVLAGGLTITQRGESFNLGQNPRAVLHALVIGRGKMTRAQLEEVLPWRVERRKSERGAVKNALEHLRDKKKLGLDINEGEQEVLMSSKGIWVDLWVFFDHVEAGEYRKAAKLLPSGGSGPGPLETQKSEPKPLRTGLERFAKKRREVLKAIKASSGRNQMMLDARERLLERSLVPGVGREVPIGDVRTAIDPIGFPWRNLRSPRKLERKPLPAEIAEILSDPASSRPKHVVVVGDHGAGKTLAAISVYLQLTDSLEDVDAAAETRPVFYVDGQNDAPEPLATESWFEQRQLDADALGPDRPILIVSHADSFFLRANAKPDEVLNWPAFRESDVLFCCSESLYEEELKFSEHLDRVFRLERWAVKDQKAFTTALFDNKTWRRFEAWRDEDKSGTREMLCMVPLNLSFVLPLVEEDDEALKSISTRWHLFDQLARLRLDASRLGDRKEQLMSELAAIAHHFYVSSKDDEAIAFSRKELEDFLRDRSSKKVKTRRAILTYQTLILAPSTAHIDYHFEHPAWGRFFVALHLSELLTSSRASEPVLKAFAKPFSKPVLELCEEMLLEGFARHEDRTLQRLREALDDEETRGTLKPTQLKVADRQLRGLLKLAESASL